MSEIRIYKALVDEARKNAAREIRSRIEQFRCMNPACDKKGGVGIQRIVLGDLVFCSNRCFRNYRDLQRALKKPVFPSAPVFPIGKVPSIPKRGSGLS